MKPQMKSKIAPARFSIEYGWISFCATPDAATALQEFGKIDKHSDDNWYTIWVDARYDLLEVYKYIIEYGKAQP